MKQILEHVTINKVDVDLEAGILKVPAFMWLGRHKSIDTVTRSLMATPDAFLSIVATPVDATTITGLPGLYISIKPSRYPDDVIERQPELEGKEPTFLHYDLVVRVNKDVYIELPNQPGSAVYNTCIYDMFAIALADRGVSIKEAVVSFHNGFTAPTSWNVMPETAAGLNVLPIITEGTVEKFTAKGIPVDENFVRIILENHIEVDLLDTFSEWS